jgi:hypothetical protein
LGRVETDDAMAIFGHYPHTFFYYAPIVFNCPVSSRSIYNGGLLFGSYSIISRTMPIRNCSGQSPAASKETRYIQKTKVI